LDNENTLVSTEPGSGWAIQRTTVGGWFLLGDPQMVNMTVQCAWCRKVKLILADESERWFPVGLVKTFDPANMTHGVCPECSEKVMAGLNTIPKRIK